MTVDVIEPEEAAEAEAAETPTSTYTAVIYFHGMGSQRRFEETSRLIDKIDKHLFSARARNEAVGMLAKIRTVEEPSRTDPKATVSYINTHYLPPGAGWAQVGTVRYYEVYWAPVMAGQKSPWRVLQWILRQQIRPFQTLGSPWRERQRLRRAALVSLFERGQTLPPGVEPRDQSRMISLYDDFEMLPAQRKYPKGDFADFQAFVAEQSAKRPDTLKRLQTLAEAWLRIYRKEEMRNAFALVTLGMVMLLSGVGAVAGILYLLTNAQHLAAATPLLKGFDWSKAPNVATAASVAGSIMVFVLGRFLTDYMGDVEAWATYAETDEKYERRARIIERGSDVLRHVLSDPRCTRAAVVSHSLGTSIAQDTLLSVSRENKARSPANVDLGPTPLGKIEHFVTMGSPIDKIEYFFESYRSASHRYKRVVEALRGDIGSYPFCANRHPHIHWVNFWDEGDAISGSLQSPASAVRTSQIVDNVHVRAFGFPAPGPSHSAYFDNRKVIDPLFRMIYLRAFSFVALPPRAGKPKDYAGAYVGPGEKPGPARFYLAAAAMAPWLVVVGAVLFLVAPRWAAVTVLTLAAGDVAILLFAYWRSQAKGHRFPI